MSLGQWLVNGRVGYEISFVHLFLSFFLDFIILLLLISEAILAPPDCDLKLFSSHAPLMHVHTSALVTDSHRLIPDIGPACFALQRVLLLQEQVDWQLLFRHPSPLMIKNKFERGSAVGASLVSDPPIGDASLAKYMGTGESCRVFTTLVEANCTLLLFSVCEWNITTQNFPHPSRDPLILQFKCSKILLRSSALFLSSCWSHVVSSIL